MKQSLGRMRTCDVAFTFRMGAGYSGDVNRTHPFGVEPCLIDPANPPLFYGELVFYDRTSVNGVRPPVDGDANATAIHGDGITVRPFPQQAQSASNSGAVALGAGNTPPVTGVIDILKNGYIMAPVVGTPNKGDTVYVWCTANSGSHVRGGFEAAASGGNTVPLDADSYFNGPPDSTGIVEIALHQ